jgi:hypothetical protein
MKVLFVTPPHQCSVVAVAGGHRELERRLDAARADVVGVSAITATNLDALEAARAAKAARRDHREGRRSLGVHVTERARGRRQLRGRGSTPVEGDEGTWFPALDRRSAAG